MTAIERVMLENQQSIMLALAQIVPDKESAQILVSQAETTGLLMKRWDTKEGRCVDSES